MVHYHWNGQKNPMWKYIDKHFSCTRATKKFEDINTADVKAVAKWSVH